MHENNRYFFLEQVLYDDKGLMAIFFWGGPGKVHDDDPLRCVWTGLKVLSVLKEEGITAYVGITYGEAFCGNVGTYSRCEYSGAASCNVCMCVDACAPLQRSLNR